MELFRNSRIFFTLGKVINFGEFLKKNVGKNNAIPVSSSGGVHLFFWNSQIYIEGDVCKIIVIGKTRSNLFHHLCAYLSCCSKPVLFVSYPTFRCKYK